MNDAESDNLPAGLLFPASFSPFRIFFWYALIYLGICFIVSLIMNQARADFNLIIVFGYLISFLFGFAFLVENRYRWFKGKLVSFSFAICTILWAIFSVALAFLFIINTIFIGGLA